VTVDAISNAYFEQESEALRRIVEEYSCFTRIIWQVSANQTDSHKVYVKSAADRPSHPLLMQTTISSPQLAASGIDPNWPDGTYKPVPVGLFAVGQAGCAGIGTVDPAIRNIHDLDGRKIELRDRPENSSFISNQILGVFSANGITTQNFYTRGAEIQELRDGIVDAVTMFWIGPTRPWGYSAQMMQESHNFYAVDLTPEAIQGLVASNPVAWKYTFPLPLYAGTLPDALGLPYDPIQDPVVYCYGGNSPHIVVSPDVEEAVIYDIVSAVIGHREEFRRYLTGDVDAFIDGLARMLYATEDVHPGARRAYEDLGVAYGLPANMEGEKERAAKHGRTFTVPAHFAEMLN
jgi:hypothetical protein